MRHDNEIGRALTEALERDPEARERIRQRFQSFGAAMSDPEMTQADAAWQAETGLPVPRIIEDIQRLAAWAGFAPETILKGDFTESDVCTIVEGAARRIRDEKTPAQPPAQPETPTRPGKPKRSTARGDARLKIVAALTKHHRYAAGSLLNQEPVGVAELARAAGVGGASVSRFFADKFKGHAAYQRACRDNDKLITSLKMLNGEFSPSLLYGSDPDRTPEGD